MGPFDYYHAQARCPRCQALFWVDGETRFFDPHHGGPFKDRKFEPDVPQPLERSALALTTARVWHDWWRVREPQDPAAVQVLVWQYELFGCDCGAEFAVILRFMLDEGPSATLAAVLLVDALAADVAEHIDFIHASCATCYGNFSTRAEAVNAAAEAPAEARAARVREYLADYWNDRKLWLLDMPASHALSPLGGEARCEHCGDRHYRQDLFLLAQRGYPQSFFGPGWPGGLITPGTRIACDLAWLAEDQDRGDYVRLHARVPDHRLTLISRRRNHGCRCGAGRSALVLHFTRDAEALTLAAITLRVVNDASDLEDIDFAEAPLWTRDPSPNAILRDPPPTREQVLHGVLAEFGR